MNPPASDDAVGQYICLLDVTLSYGGPSPCGVIREEVAIICVRNFLLTEGKVY